MTRATDRFIHEIQRSHTVVAYVMVTSPTGETRKLVAIDGEVTVDRTANFRRQTKVNCIDPLGDLVPDDDANGLLTPFGTEIRPYRGVRYSDGEEEVYPLGVFRLSSSSFQESSSSGASSGVRISIAGFDRSRTVSRDKFTNVYTIPAGTNILTAIKQIIDRTFPDVQYDAISTTMKTTAPTVYTIQDDPWVAVSKLAESIGCEIYFDVDGNVVIAPPTDIDVMPAPDYTFIENNRNVLTDMSKEYSDEPGFNGFIVEGASPGDTLPPVRGEAWDMEPSSPTYRYGPYGEVPNPVQDTNCKTVADCIKAADSLLKAQLGFSAGLQATSWVNPAMEAGDIAQVRRQRMNVDQMFVIDSFNIPLKASAAQTMKLRSKRRV